MWWHLSCVLQRRRDWWQSRRWQLSWRMRLDGRETSACGPHIKQPPHSHQPWHTQLHKRNTHLPQPVGLERWCDGDTLVKMQGESGNFDSSWKIKAAGEGQKISHTQTVHNMCMVCGLHTVLREPTHTEAHKQTTGQQQRQKQSIWVTQVDNYSRGRRRGVKYTSWKTVETGLWYAALAGRRQSSRSNWNWSLQWMVKNRRAGARSSPPPTRYPVFVKVLQYKGGALTDALIRV